MKTLRPTLMSLSLAIAAFAAAQYEDPALHVKVDFKNPASSANAAMERLSAQSGVKLMTSPQTAGEILYVNVTDVALADLMKRISIATSGEWRAEEGGFRLIRPAGRANAEANAERVERVNKIRQAIAKRVAALTAKPTQGTAGGINFGGFMGMGGDADRPITKLLALIDPSAIANLEKGGRIVFATNPNRMQRPIYGNIAPIIGEYIQAHNANVAAKPDVDSDDGGMSDEDRAALQEFMKIFGGEQNEKPVDARPAKVLLAISRGGGMMSMFGGGIQVELMLFNDKGEIVLKGQSSISDGESIFEDIVNGMGAVAEATLATVPGAEPPKPPVVEKFPGENGDIEFTKTSREVATLFGEGGMMGGNFGMPKKLSTELEALMLRPDLNDPLSFAETDSLDSVAKIKNWDIVANIPDSRLSFFSTMMGQGVSKKVDDYLNSIKKDKAISFDLVTSPSAGSWLTIKPAKPVAARMERVDRVSLARLLAASKSKSLPSLDDYALYAQKNEAPFDTPAATLYLALFAPNAMAQGMMGLTDWNMIRFYGGMNPTQRMGLKNGVTVSMLNLEFGQRTLLEKMLFGSNHQLKVGAPKVDTEPFFLKMFSTMFGGQASSWKQEPTEVMPSGLPNEGVVHMSSLSSMIGKSEDENEMTAMFGALGPAELAMFDLFKDDPNMQAAGAAMPEIGKLKLGSRNEYRFLFQVAVDVSTQRTLNDDNVPKDGQVVTIDQLPDAFKKQIAESLAALKNSPFFKMMTMGSRTRESVPPPSR